MSDWKVFQTDVLDVFRQYEGFFDFFERVGSLSDNSRPDCIARISRENKKEIWIVDAKNKPKISEEDRKRMEKYSERIESKPMEVGLEFSEFSRHELRKIFVTSSGSLEVEGCEQLSFSQLHSFLQEELVYTDTDKVVRDVSRMMEKEQLSHSQARLLFNSIKPFEERLERGIEKLEQLEEDFIGLELEKPPIESYDFNIPVDAVLRHRKRDEVFIFDIPYSERAIDGIEQKVEEVRKKLEKVERPVYYTALNTFSERESDYILRPKEVRDELRQTAGILSPETLSELFRPKIPVEKNYGENFVELRDTVGTGFRVRIETEDDVEHRVEMVLPENARSELQDHFLNANNVGKLNGNRLRHKVKVTEELNIRHSGRKESLESYRSSIKGMFRTAINPALGKKINRTV